MTDNEYLTMCFDAFNRAQRSGHDRTGRYPVLECSSTAWEELADGTIRRFYCLADYEGLVAVYRDGSHGLPERLDAWPQWLIGLDREPDWRATCRRLEANKKRRQRRAQVRAALQLAKSTLPQLVTPDMPAVLHNDDIDLSVLDVPEPDMSVFEAFDPDLSVLDVSDSELTLDEGDDLAA